MQTSAEAVFRTTSRDASVLAAALAHGVVVALSLGATAALPGVPAVRAAVVAIIALGTCWGSNTVAHIHLHSPLFRSARANRLFSLYLSSLLGIPQAWWKRRHLWHHAGEPGEARARRRKLGCAHRLDDRGTVLREPLLESPEPLPQAPQPRPQRDRAR